MWSKQGASLRYNFDISRNDLQQDHDLVEDSPIFKEFKKQDLWIEEEEETP